MKKKFFAVFVGFLLAINISTAQAAQVPIYGSGAADLYEYLLEEFAEVEDIPYEIGDFVRAPDADIAEEGLKAWACGLSRKTAQDFEAAIIFQEGEGEQVFQVATICPAEDFDDEIVEMLLIAAIGILEPAGLEENELDALLKKFTDNPQQGYWNVWSGGKNFILEFAEDEKVAGFLLYATNG